MTTTKTQMVLQFWSKATDQWLDCYHESDNGVISESDVVRSYRNLARGKHTASKSRLVQRTITVSDVVLDGLEGAPCQSS